MIPWLEPDICDHLNALQAQGTRDVVVAPIGFLSDHMEVIYDLDREAAECAQNLDMTMIRAGTVGVDAHFVTLLRHLIVERMTANPNKLSIGNDGPSPDVCPIDCCLPG
jgi:ferrochelatase